jgi:hypothetical protein
VRTLSVDGLLWRPTAAAPDEDEDVVVDLVKEWARDIGSWSPSRSRRELFELTRQKGAALHGHLAAAMHAQADVPSAIDPALPFEVHSLRPSVRGDWSGRPRCHWIVELTQRMPQWVAAADEADARPPDYYFRGGCTLVLDAETGRVRYSIRKPLDAARRERQRRYVLDEGGASAAATYFGGPGGDDDEPFAALHRF